jgi:lipoate-protein ligase A
MNWLFLNSGEGDPAFNMAQDEALLEAMPRLQKPVLRFYGWTEPAATFGYFQKYSEVAAATQLRPLIRRPTGGGIVPHDADWTYSAVFPTGHEWHLLKAEESYRRVHEWLRLAFAEWNIETKLAPCCKKTTPGQCFVGHEKFDLLWHGKKIAGAAQRRNKLGLLIQGSVQPPPVKLVRTDWEDALCTAAGKNFSVTWTKLVPDGELRRQTDALAREKFSLETYNQKR